MAIDIAAELGTTHQRAVGRLMALGYTKACTRCSGGGHYSFNQMHGTVCFGCSGAGKLLVKVTRAILDEAKARIAAGELAPYFEANRRRLAAKKCVNRVLDAWRATFVATEFEKKWLESREKYPLLYAANKAMCDAFDRVQAADLEALRGGAESVKALLAVAEQAIADIKSADETYDGG